MGIPVFLHYCGGELEKVNYVVKGTGCCGDDENEADNSGCCKDEKLVITNTTDFTIKQINNYDLVKTFCDLFYTALPFSEKTIKAPTAFNRDFSFESPPKLQNTLVISTSVLRI